MSGHGRLNNLTSSYRAFVQELIRHHADCTPGDGTTPGDCGQLAQLIEVCYANEWEPHPQ
ncbi:hypothetical protein [Nocardia arizonensis]|uniref:hypothetical protein n=1 Tax=Nocardia arizonensis TaxID=1141647 RepID=UPI000ACFA641|nr:hypothetical protein [Nocardia arizonensis]